MRLSASQQYFIGDRLYRFVSKSIKLILLNAAGETLWILSQARNCQRKSQRLGLSKSAFLSQSCVHMLCIHSFILSIFRFAQFYDRTSNIGRRLRTLHTVEIEF